MKIIHNKVERITKDMIRSQNPHLTEDEVDGTYELIYGNGKVVPYHEALPKEYH